MNWQRKTLAIAVMAALPLSAQASGRYISGSDEDPYLRYANYLNLDHQHLSAVTELMRAQGRDAQSFEASPKYWSALAQAYLSFGMRDRAEALYRNVAAAASDPLLGGRARLRMAEFEYERGYLDSARASLLRAREKLPTRLRNEWQDLYARVLLAQGRYGEAVSVLQDADPSQDSQSYLRLNLGIALINAGQVDRGRTILDRVGRFPAADAQGRGVRDRANLILGWHFLQNKLGASAKPVLERVRSQGLAANRALLGLGWAELAPAGERQLRELKPEEIGERGPAASLSNLGSQLRPGYHYDPYARLGIRSFPRARMAKDEEEAVRRALAVWLILMDRDPQDPAVQEAWLAIPYALDRLGAHEQAVRYYEQAAKKLEQARNRTQSAIRSVEGGRMVETIVQQDPDDEGGWTWELRDLPFAPETYYLQSLLAEHRFAEALKNYRDARVMLRRVKNWRGRIAQMEKIYAGQRQQSVDPRVLFDRAKRNYQPLRSEVKIPLRSEDRLAVPGRYGAKLGPQQPIRPALRFSGLPGGDMSGTYDSLQGLDEQAETMQDKVTKLAAAQAKLLKNMARGELVAQRKQIDKYLVDTRFALARLYDREVPEPDQDEVDVHKFEKGETLPESRGEYEIVK